MQEQRARRSSLLVGPGGVKGGRFQRGSGNHRLTSMGGVPKLKYMDVRLSNPELEAKVEEWVSATGRPADELVEDAMAGYFEELARTKAELDRRFDEVKSGAVELIDGDEAFRILKERARKRNDRSG